MRSRTEKRRTDDAEDHPATPASTVQEATEPIAPGSAFRLLWESRAMVMTLLCQNGASAKQASELGNRGNGDWAVHGARGHNLRGLIVWEMVKTSTILPRSPGNSRVLLPALAMPTSHLSRFHRVTGSVCLEEICKITESSHLCPLPKKHKLLLLALKVPQLSFAPSSPLIHP